MHFVGGADIRIFRKTKDAWGDTEPQYSGITLEWVGIAPRTSKTTEGEGFRGRVQSGYTIYPNQDQLELIEETDEFEVIMPDGTKVYYGLDGSLWGGVWNNPLSSWQPGNEINLTYLHHDKTDRNVGRP